MSKQAPRFPSVRQWVRAHRLLSIGLVAVFLLFLIWNAQPISLALFRLYAQDCGSVFSSRGRQGAANGVEAKQAERCFWQAYQQCHAAILTSTFMGVDTRRTDTFTVANHFGTCSLADTVDVQGATIGPSFGPIGPASACRGLTQKLDGLHFLACGDQGEILVPGP